MHRLGGAGVDEFKLTGVQALADKPLFGARCAVGEVAEQRVTDVCHVNSDLMRSAGLKAASYMRVAVVAGDHLPVRHGASGVFIRHRHALAV